MNGTKRLLCAGLWLLAGLSCMLSPVAAQLTPRFGKNKVHYKDFEWAILKTSHFKIYFYRSEEQLAHNAASMAERAYQHLSAALEHSVSKKIPLIIYASSDDFQQTEVISGIPGEGISGVTESLKGRIIIPFLGSYRDFNHVLIHELVHAFQFDMLGAIRSPVYIASGGLNMPLWFIEGMAEYLSEYSNPLTDMWLADAVAQDALPKARQIEAIQDIRAYRFGESLLEYLVDQHGPEIIGDVFRAVIKTGSWDQAIQKTADTSWEAIYEGWLEMVKQTYTTDAPGQVSLQEQARHLIRHKKDVFTLNIIPTISPDGQLLAFISDREVYRTIYLASAETGEIMKTLVAGERRGTYETLRFLNTSMAWSPDSQQLAFTARAGGENAIYLLDVESDKMVHKLTPDVVSLSFLAWSPDGRRIVFTGTKNGQEDVFLISLDTGTMRQLTDDLYANRHPAWSPDGSRLAFTTDAGDFSKPEKLQFGPMNLAIYDLAAQTTHLATNTPMNDFTPVWSPDGQILAFISDRTGVCNIYLLEMPISPDRPNPPVQLTDVTTGIVGLTEHNPALSWAAQQGTLVFSGFHNQGWDIFALKNPLVHYRAYQAAVGFDQAAAPLHDEAVSVADVGKKDWAYALPQDDMPEPQKYKARLTPEYIIGGGGGTENDFVILAYAGLSDMLSNHQLDIGCNLTSVWDKSDFLITYTNHAHRLGYEAYAFQFEGEGTYSMEDANLELEVERGVGVDLAWPFDKFRRLECGLEGRMVSGTLLPDTSAELDASSIDADQYMFVSPSLAYVHDTTLYTGIGPLDGQRWRLSVQPAFGDFSYLTLAADYRRYLHVTPRSTVAFRAFAASSFGENARIFEIGGPNTFRGKEVDADDPIQGTNAMLTNLEYRFPLLPKINILRGAVFWDMALGWTEDVQPFSTRDTSVIRLNDLQAAYGAGLRIPLRGPFGTLSLRIDVAQATDLVQQIGDRKVLFSLGNEF
jgi:hypothetical protein